jgi:hypothetical protein
VSSLKVSVATGDSGPVLVLAGETPDPMSVTRLTETLATQESGQPTI